MSTADKSDEEFVISNQLLHASSRWRFMHTNWSLRVRIYFGISKNMKKSCDKLLAWVTLALFWYSKLSATTKTSMWQTHFSQTLRQRLRRQKKKRRTRNLHNSLVFLSFVCLLLFLISFRFHANYFYFKNCENLLSLPDAWRERIVLLLFLSIANFGFLRKQFFKDLLLAHARWVLRIRSAHFVNSTIVGHFKLHYVESREGP